MNRKEKIEVLKGIATGSKSINELNVRHGLIVCDDPEKYQHLLGNINKDEIVTSKEYQILCEKGLFRGTVFGLNPIFIAQHS